MTATDKIQSGLKLIVSLISLIATFYTVVDLTYFLSYPSIGTKQKIFRNDSWIAVLKSLFINQLLLSLFVLQHSVLAIPDVKNWVSSLKLQVLHRSIYVILTSITLQIMIKYWHDVPEVALWSVNVNINLYWWSFFALHAFAWAIIYVGTICMDVNELLGFKQIYYSIRDLPEPIEYKSLELKRLYAHMRHPSFLGFLIIIWAIPIMSLDRLLLAVIWSLYMYLAWNTDRHDYTYQQVQFVKKFHELNYVK